MKRANCRGLAPKRDADGLVRNDPWFPAKGEQINPGKIKCFTCHVRAECAGYRERTGSHDGMWAGEIEKRD